MSKTQYRAKVNFLRIYEPYFIINKNGEGQWYLIKDIINEDDEDKIVCVNAAGSENIFGCKAIFEGDLIIKQDSYMSYDESDKRTFVRIKEE